MNQQLQEWLDRILGIGVIPPGWKAAIYGLLGALVAVLVEFGVELPDWIDDSALTKVAWFLAVLASVVLKGTRGATEPS